MTNNCLRCGKEKMIPAWKYCEPCGHEVIREKQRDRYVRKRDELLAYAKRYREARKARRAALRVIHT